MSTPIQVSTSVSVFRGTQYIELTSGADYVKVLDDGRDLPDSFARGDSPKGPWVRIGKSDLDRRFERTVTATWDVERQLVRARKIPGADPMSPIDEARRRLAIAGVGHDLIMWSDQDWQGQEGVWVITHLVDGDVRAALWDRGEEQHVQIFPDEQTAATQLEQQLMMLARPKREDS
jgi:hypothetical protein